jgi:uncharacterized protein (TIGR02271 family)
MSGGENIQEGMQVYGPGDQLIGRVERVHGDGFDAEGRHYARNAVSRVEHNRIYLQEGGTQQGRGAQGQRAEGDMRVPVAEERLNVEKRQAELGAVELRKTVTEEEQTVPVELLREEVRVERVDAGDRPVRPGEDLFREGTIRVPVRGEEAVVRKEAVVTGEVVVDKENTTERQEISDTVRKERVEVDEDYDQHRAGFQRHFQGRQGRQQGDQSATRSWDEAEPNYRYGYGAGRDNQYRGREFDDVEPDLRRDYETRYGRNWSEADAGGTSGMGTNRTTGDRGPTPGGRAAGGEDVWQQLREEIREGWNRARGEER